MTVRRRVRRAIVAAERALTRARIVRALNLDTDETKTLAGRRRYLADVRRRHGLDRVDPRVAVADAAFRLNRL